MDQQDKYSPYCPVCSACGEEGCCSPINCTQAPDGHYCQSYLLDLHLAYRMDKYFMENIYDELSDELKSKYDAEWNRVYDDVYKDQIQANKEYNDQMRLKDNPLLNKDDLKLMDVMIEDEEVEYNSQDTDEEDDTFSLYENEQTKSIRELANKQTNKK